MLYKEAVGSMGLLSNSSQNNLLPRYRGEFRGRRQLGAKRLSRSASLNTESCSDGLVEYSLSLFKTCGGLPSRIRPLLAIWGTHGQHTGSQACLCAEKQLQKASSNFHFHTKESDDIYPLERDLSFLIE